METDWIFALKPLFDQYGKRKHPLDYKNKYQLIVMVILSAQDSDNHINELAPEFFKAYPSIENLAGAMPEDLHRYIGSVRNFGNKANWLVKLALTIGNNSRIPSALSDLIALPGIGRKSANVIIRESGDPAEGIIVDLHVLRVAPRLGIAIGSKPEKIEQQLMSVIPRENWNEAGMSLSFLGREICRPTNPKCINCIMSKACSYFNNR